MNNREGQRTYSFLRWDTLWMLLGSSLCVVICCIFTHNRIFWEDEMLGWMLIHDPSWSHMVSSWKMGADGGGFLFYLLARLWFKIFGASNISFRLISATCFAAAFCVTWVTARRLYSVPVVAFALFNTWFFSPPMVMHMAEGRFYGLLVFTTSIIVWLTLIKCNKDVEGHLRTPAWLYFAMFASHALLTTSHILGILYSAALLAALIMLDRHNKRVRLVLYASAAASWLLLFPEREAISNSARVGQPWFWTVPPDFIRFLGGITGFSAEITIVELALAAIITYSFHRTKILQSSMFREETGRRRPVYYVTAALLIVPFSLAVQARFGVSLYINRYLLPVNIGLAFLTMEAVTIIPWQVVLPSKFHVFMQWKGKMVLTSAYICMLLAWVFWHMMPFTLGAPNYTGTLSSQLPKGIPILFEDAWGFTETIGREHDAGVLYTYLLDWPYVTSSTAPRLEVTQFHLMENWKKVGYFSGSIQYRDDFLHKHSQFIVLRRPVSAKDRDGIIIGNPLAKRFAETPGFVVHKLKRIDKTDFEAWLICKDHCTP